MNKRNGSDRALAGVALALAPALLAFVLLASGANAAGFTANLVTPPVPWDDGNSSGGANNSIALPQCGGGANDGFVPCASNADCTPTCSSGVCINNFLTNAGGACTGNGDCVGPAGVCANAAFSDGITVGDMCQGLNLHLHANIFQPKPPPLRDFPATYCFASAGTSV